MNLLSYINMYTHTQTRENPTNMYMHTHNIYYTICINHTLKLPSGWLVWLNLNYNMMGYLCWRCMLESLKNDIYEVFFTWWLLRLLYIEWGKYPLRLPSSQLWLWFIKSKKKKAYRWSKVSFTFLLENYIFNFKLVSHNVEEVPNYMLSW